MDTHTNIVLLTNGYHGHGATGTRLESGRCSCCGSSGFSYRNGTEWSAEGIRGYRCMSCGTIKPEVDGPKSHPVAAI